MGTEKPPSRNLGGFSCVVMLISFAKHIITQVPNEMQEIRCRLGAVFFYAIFAAAVIDQNYARKSFLWYTVIIRYRVLKWGVIVLKNIRPAPMPMFGTPE